MPVVNAVVPLDKITPHSQNYNAHPEEQIHQLGASYTALGQFRSVVLWQQEDGTYIQLAGHGVVEAMKREGAKEVRADIHPPSLDPLTAKQIMLADNLHAQNSSPDSELLVTLLQEQQDAGFDLAALGTDDEALRQMLEALGDEYAGSDESDGEEDTIPEQVETRCKPGDIWQLGRHRIACMDSLDPETLRTLFPERVPDMVWADPPYGISIVATNGYVGGGEAYDIPFGGVKNRTRGDVGGTASHMRRTGKTYLEESQAKGLGSTYGAKPFGSRDVRGSIGASNIVDVGKYAPVIGDETITTAVLSSRLCLEAFPDAIQFWWGANYYAHMLPPSKCWVVWDKENTGNFADAELAWCSHDSVVRIFKHMWNGMLKDSEHGQKRVHPTQKPCALACWCYERYGKEGDVIYDPFLGSGMSLIAAENLNRTVIGCELSPEYIDIICTRWETLTGQTATLLQRSAEASHAESAS